MHRNHNQLKPIHKKNRIIIFEVASKAGARLGCVYALLVFVSFNFGN